MRILSISPQNEYPPLAGGAKRFFAMAEAFRSLGIHSDNLFRNGRMIDGSLTLSAASEVAGRDRKALLAGKSILLGKSYNEVRFARPAWYRQWESVINGDYDAIIVHFLCAYPLFKETFRGSAEVVIDTHNDDWRWWSNMRTGLVSGLVGTIGIRRSTQIMRMVPDGTLMSHVSTDDQSAYERRFPRLRHLVAPNACHVKPRNATRPYGRGRIKKLLFFGSLSSRINVDGLRHFQNLYWPELKNVSLMTVAGSNPSHDVVEMCRRNNWELHANASESEVEEHFDAVDFSVMPFPYGNGSKHKLFDSLGRGLPVISTKAGICGIENPCDGIAIANEPSDWKETLFMSEEEYRSREKASLEWARMHSWKASVETLLDALKLKRQLV